MSKRKKNSPLPGFPRKDVFKTKEEVEAYFSSEKIQCLLCGKWFESIGGVHMVKKHGISTDEYREMYGLPWDRGLDGRRSHEKKIEIGKKLWLEGNRPDTEKALREAWKVKPRPPQPYRKDYYSKCMLSFHGLTRKYRREDFEAALDRMRKQQRSLEDVCGDPDMPASTIVMKYARNHPEFEEELKRTYYGLPHTLQVRSGRVSPRLEMACRRMLADGMSLRKIAKALGISFYAVKRILQSSPEGLRLLEEEAPNRWRGEDYKRILDRVRNEHRTVNDVCGDPDLPSHPMYLRYIRKNPGFKEKVKQAYYSLPYPVQVRSGFVSPRFRIDCQRLRATKMRAKRIGRALGVSFEPVKRALEEAPEGFIPLLKTGSSKWRVEDYEALLDRMAKQQRTLKDVCKDPDLPALPSWYPFKKKHPEFVEKYRQVVFSQPYHMQIEAGFFSPGLLREFKRLRARGLTNKEISEELDVGQTHVETLARRIRRDESG